MCDPVLTQKPGSDSTGVRPPNFTRASAEQVFHGQASSPHNSSTSESLQKLGTWVLTHLELCCRQINISYHLRAGVLHLQTGIQLQKVETAILAVEVFHGACAHISHHFGKLHCTLGHRKEECSVQPCHPLQTFWWHSKTSKSLYPALELLKEKHMAREFRFPGYFICTVYKGQSLKWIFLTVRIRKFIQFLQLVFSDNTYLKYTAIPFLRWKQFSIEL